MLVPVVVHTELYGDTVAIAREIQPAAAMLHMSYAPPLGTVVTITIGEGPVAIAVRAEVTHHRYELRQQVRPGVFRLPMPTEAPRLIGVRFLEFIDGGEPAIAEHIQ